MSEVDKLFETTNPGVGEFKFDENVASVFDDMISRSVPLYEDVQRAIPRLIRLLHRESVRVVDLGCSTGTSFRVIGNSLPNQCMDLIGVDTSEPMLNRCRKRLAGLPANHSLDLSVADLLEFELPECDVVLMNYTMQFVPAEQRPQLLRRIFAALKPGGFLLLSEKFSHENEPLNREWFELYFEFKRRAGYSELEIARKRDALEDVLVPFSVKQNERLLAEAGFASVELILKWFNFGTFLVYR